MSQQINLFNPIFLKKKKYFSAVTMAQALGLILVGCVLLASYMNYQLSLLAGQAEATSAQLAAVRAQTNKINAAYGPKQRDQSIEDDVRKAEAEVRSLQQVFDILQKGDFGNTEGYAEYMRAFARQIVDGVWLTRFTIEGAGSEIALHGHALKPELVPAYLNRLKREPALQGKSFAALEIATPQTAQTEQAAGDSAAARPKAPAGFVDFSLRSSGVATEPAGGRGK